MQKIELVKIYKRKSALVIDDFPDMRGSIRRMLENFGINRVETASNGEEAMRLCEERSFDIILADYNLGDLKSGQQILEELRFKRLLKNTGIYMMVTAETTKDMVFGALEYQPDDYLTKPFTQVVLQKRLDRILLEKEALYDILRAMDLLDFDLAIELCKTRIQAHDKYERRCFKIMASCYYKKHKYEQSLDIYQKINDERPVEWAEIGMGKCLMAMDELDKAEAIFQKLARHGSRCLEVYDCLADIKTRKGDLGSAQEILQDAVEISPNSVTRQQKLAQVSEDNHQWDVATKSHRKVIRLGNNSVYESPDMFFNMARCLSNQIKSSGGKDKGKLKDVEEVLRRAKRRYGDQGEVAIQSDLIQSTAYAEAQEHEKSRELVQQAAQKMEHLEQQPAQMLLDMAKTHKALGNHEKSQQILKQLAVDYADDAAICEQIDRLSDEPLTRKGKQKAVNLNNKGKQLFADKNYEDAISLFAQATRFSPNNIGLNLNLMLALVQQMTQSGATTEMLKQCHHARESIKHIASDHPLYERYKLLCQHLDKLTPN